MAHKATSKTASSANLCLEEKLWLKSAKLRDIMDAAESGRDNESAFCSLPSQNSIFLSSPGSKAPNPNTMASDLPADLAAIFAAAPDTRESDIAALTHAADALDRDPEFLADYAKGLVVEDVLRPLEDSGLSKNALAEKIGKSRQYLSKILDEDRRVNFTIETLAKLSAALGLQLHVRMLPPQ